MKTKAAEGPGGGRRLCHARPAYPRANAAVDREPAWRSGLAPADGPAL